MHARSRPKPSPENASNPTSSPLKSREKHYLLPTPLALPPVPFLIRAPLFTTAFPLDLLPSPFRLKLARLARLVMLPVRLALRLFCTFRADVLATLTLLRSGLIPSEVGEGMPSIFRGIEEGCCSSISIARCTPLVAEHCSLVSAARLRRVRLKNDGVGAEVGMSK